MMQVEPRIWTPPKRRLVRATDRDVMRCSPFFGSASFGMAGRAGKVASGFDPATLTLSGWWRADGTTGYDVSAGTGTMLAVASAGTSGSNGDLTEGTNPPAEGAAVNTHVPADFDGTNDTIANASTLKTTFVAGATGTIVVLFNADTAAAAAANKYDDPALVSDTNNAFNLGFSDGGLGVALHDGVWQQPARVACTASAWHMAFVRWSGGTMEYGVDAGALSSASAGTLSTGIGSSVLRVGSVAISTPARFDGKILEVMTALGALDDTARSDIRSYFNARYNLAL